MISHQSYHIRTNGIRLDQIRLDQIIKSKSMSGARNTPASDSVCFSPATLPILFGSNSIITTSGLTVLIVLRTRLADSSDMCAVPIIIIFEFYVMEENNKHIANDIKVPRRRSKGLSIMYDATARGRK